jgi:hypothetical protein
MQPTIHFQKKRDILISEPAFFGNVMWVAFSIPSGSLSLVKYPVLRSNKAASIVYLCVQPYAK